MPPITDSRIIVSGYSDIKLWLPELSRDFMRRDSSLFFIQYRFLSPQETSNSTANYQTLARCPIVFPSIQLDHHTSEAEIGNTALYGNGLIPYMSVRFEATYTNTGLDYYGSYVAACVTSLSGNLSLPKATVPSGFITTLVGDEDEYATYTITQPLVNSQFQTWLPSGLNYLHILGCGDKQVGLGGYSYPRVRRTTATFPKGYSDCFFYLNY